jgi:hypothetical protein
VAPNLAPLTQVTLLYRYEGTLFQLHFLVAEACMVLLAVWASGCRACYTVQTMLLTLF